jgi:septal ring factor EnvC (AmiA/AmiB activator)
VDAYEIEDTSDWLGCPTPLETCRHQLRMLENEIEELTLQLRQARENIFKLVEMLTAAPTVRYRLRAHLKKADSDVSRLHAETTEMSSELRSLANISHQNKHLFQENQRLLREKQNRERQ